MVILIPALVLLSIALVCAVLLTLSSVYFGVNEDTRVSEIRECLPGVNCGVCGFSGCDGYAKALSSGETNEVNRCTPGGDGTAKRLAEIMGTEASGVVERVAYVACNGDCTSDGRKFNYEGVHTCRAANVYFAGDRLCSFACLGYGDCMRICPRDAIYMGERGVAQINPRKCIGCGLCMKTCPNGIIALVEDTERIIVKCRNHDKGAKVRRACEVGCIACGKCEKICPSDAIHVIDNLATIDYEKCTSCGACVEVCPVKCIHAENLICGSHFE